MDTGRRVKQVGLFSSLEFVGQYLNHATCAQGNLCASLPVQMPLLLEG